MNFVWKLAMPKEDTQKVEAYLRNLGEEWYKIMPQEFGISRDKLKGIGEVIMTRDRTTLYALRLSTLEPDIAIGMDLPCWHLGLPHELGHYAHSVINPAMEDKKNPPFELACFTMVPTPFYYLGELVAEYSALRFFDIKSQLQDYREITGTESANPGINRIYDKDKILLAKLVRMNKKEAIEAYPEVFK
ncbi:hypothetical protein HYZ97_01090 [Candidatus Pacearchaeota archaeon]|nr:hypothetical protein [Candidatus Pacearchaeota archaeon]